MPDTPSTSTTPKASVPATPTANDECPLCHSLRGAATEGVFDVHGSWSLEGVNPGDPVWQQDYCWKCGAKYS